MLPWSTLASISNLVFDHLFGHRMETPPIDRTEALSVGEKAGYGLGDFASNLFWKTWEFFLVYFYTDVFGLSARATGQLLLGTRFVDALSDPLVGYLADRTQTSWGRFRPYLLWMCVPLAVTAVITFSTPDFSPTNKLIYAYVTYTALMVAYTAINIPYGALLGVISADSAERTSVSTYRFVLAFTGGLVIQWFTLDLVRWFGGTKDINVAGTIKTVVVDERYGFTMATAVFASIAVVAFLITFATTRERVEPEIASESTFAADLRFICTNARLHQTFLLSALILAGFATALSRSTLVYLLAAYAAASILSWGLRRFVRRRTTHRSIDQAPSHSTLADDFDDLTRNRPWLSLGCFGMLQLTGLFIRGGATLYYFKYFCNDASMAPTFLALGSGSAIVGMLFTNSLAKRFSKRSLMITLNVGVAMSIFGFQFVDADQWGAMLVLQTLTGLIGGPIPVLLWSMYADVADYSEWKTHRRATGLVFAAATFSQKLGCAMGAAMTGFALDFFCYAPPTNGIEHPQSQFTVEGLRLMMGGMPAALILASACCLFWYDITRQVEQQVQQELGQRKQPSRWPTSATTTANNDE